MSGTAWVFVGVLSSFASGEVAGEQPLAILEVSNVAGLQGRIERSRFRRWPTLLFGDAAKALTSGRSNIVSTWSGAFREGAPVFSFGLPTGVPGESALMSDEAYRAMDDFSPRADLRAVVHVPRLLSWIVSRRSGSAVVRNLRLLGLDSMQISTAAATLQSDRELWLKGRSQLGRSRQSLVQTLGPSVKAEWPRGALDAHAFLAASVVPEAILQRVMQVFASERPLEHALMRAQLAVLEEELGLSLASGVFGSSSRIWAAYQDREGRWLAMLGLRSPLALGRFLTTLSKIYPSLSAERLALPASTAFRVSGAFVALTEDMMILSGSQAALHEHLTRVVNARGAVAQPCVLCGGTGVVFGESRGTRVLTAAFPGKFREDPRVVTGFRVEHKGSTFELEAKIRR